LGGGGATGKRGLFPGVWLVVREAGQSKEGSVTCGAPRGGGCFGAESALLLGSLTYLLGTQHVLEVSSCAAAVISKHMLGLSREAIAAVEQSQP